MYAPLPKVEIILYFILWTSGIFYAVYNVYLNQNQVIYDEVNLQLSQIPLIERQKDVSDFEWNLWIPLLGLLLPWIVIHFVLAQILCYVNKQMVPLWHFTIGGLFLFTFMGPGASLFVFVQPCIYFGILLFRNRNLIWTFSITVLMWLHSDSGLSWLQLPFEREYFLHTMLSWLHLRCISFCLDKLEEKNTCISFMDFINFLGYCFYLPTQILGPLIMYGEYEKGVMKEYLPWTTKRVLSFTLQLLRFLMWLFVTELLLHYIYFNAFKEHPEIVVKLGWGAFYGLGYCMGQFFMLKYTVIYGLPATIAQAESITAPRHPKCIARIHLYSDMWRDFDHGLYLFIFEYIYLPWRGQDAKFIMKLRASFVCFSFIYLWHNTYNFVLIWSLLNFICVTIEGLCKNISMLSVYQRIESYFLSQENSRRFNALIASPLFILSACTNFIFCGSAEMGRIYFQRLFEGSCFVNTILLVFCYCGCQVSIEVKNWELQKMKVK